MKAPRIPMKLQWNIIGIRMKIPMKYPRQSTEISIEIALNEIWRSHWTSRHYTHCLPGNCLVFIIKVVTTPPNWSCPRSRLVQGGSGMGPLDPYLLPALWETMVRYDGIGGASGGADWRRGGNHFYDKNQAVAWKAMCIMPGGSMRSLYLIQGDFNRYFIWLPWIFHWDFHSYAYDISLQFHMDAWRFH